ncbi:MAG: TonB-dependent receptor, partial [Ignavibacteriales bacterium]|nr:TonB-dependent receptor [Ignavibacteriales bacterium]
MIKSKIKKISFFFVLLTCLTPYLLYSQGQTGKLVGHIFDSATNEALIGVNVVIEGTTIGASTDINGRFAILNIQPGTYNVVCSMVGYSKTTQTNVVIYIDRTTEITVQMQDESYQLGEVVVLANKSPIIKDRTSSQDHLSNEQIKVAPVEGLRGALDLSAGFQKDSKGDYSVRGSGSYEVNFQVDGVEQKSSNTSVPGSGGVDKADNSWKYDVNPLGVQQLQLITGGFSAEYGNSQAGVVKVVLKEGTPKFSGEFRVEYRPPGQYHYGDYIYDKNNYEWQKWGSVDNWIKTPNLDPNDPNYLKEWIKLNYGSGSLGYELAKERYKPYLNTGIYQDSLLAMDSLIYALTWAHDIWIKNHEPSDEHILGVYDYRQYAYTRYLFGFGGPLGKDP